MCLYPTASNTLSTFVHWFVSSVFARSMRNRRYQSVKFTPVRDRKYREKYVVSSAHSSAALASDNGCSRFVARC